jgi:hypothetical protein
MNIIGQYNQNLFDIVIRYYGSLDYLFQFLSVNPQVLSITEPAVGNQYIVIPNSTPAVKNFNKINASFATYYQNPGKSFDRSFNMSFN